MLTNADATTRIPVMSGDNRSGLDLSDDDDGEDVKDEEEEENSAAMAVVSTPDSMIPATMMQHPHMQAHTDSESGYQARNMSVRFHTQMEPQQGSYSDVSYMPRSVSFQPTSPTAQDPNRRSFASSSGFHSPQQNMFGWGQQNTLVSNGPNTAYYVSSSQTLPQQSTGFQLPLPTSQPMLPPPLSSHHYDMSTAPRFDTGSNIGLQVRTNSNGLPQHHGMAEYYHDNSGYGHNDAEHHS